MGQFEVDARETLLRRRRRLAEQRHAAPRLGDPSARWVDYEGAPAPLPAHLERELAEIDAALSRIEAGRYGRCLACDGPMGLQRMRAIPEARYCVGCSGQVVEVG